MITVNYVYKDVLESFRFPRENQSLKTAVKLCLLFIYCHSYDSY